PTHQMRDTIRNMARGVQAGILSEREASTEGHALSVLNAFAGRTIISLAEITAAFIKTYGGEYERPIMNRWIGSILRRLGIGLYKSNGVVVLVPGQEERIAALIERYGISDVAPVNDESI